VSSYEDPVTTVIRLLSKSVKVVRDDTSLASIYVSSQWYDRELFTNYDAQISVGLVSSQDQKLEISGKVRRRLGRLRVNLWTTDRPASVDPGREIRQKLVDNVNSIIRQNMNIPNQTIYDLNGLGYPSGTPHKALAAASTSELTPSDPSWAELSPTDYQKLWAQDGVDYSKSASVNLQYGLMLFRFYLDPKATVLQKIVLSFVGYGTAPGGNGSTIKVWNPSASAWQNAASGTAGANETVTITLTSNLSNYVDSNGYVWLLVRTTNPSDGSTPAVINCDYASCTITVNGIIYLDVVSFSDKDQTNVKPFIFRTEFLLKSWILETITVS
jgi:hypothetical protein